MRIGQDISIQTCRDEGYGVIDFKVRELYPNGRAAGMDKTAGVEFTQSLPVYAREEMGHSVGDPIIEIRAAFSWNDLQEIYQDKRKGIDDMIGGNHDIENPTEYDILNLASDIQMYCGWFNV